MLTSQLRQLLRHVLQSGDYAALPATVAGLSHADRRQCGVLLGEELLPAMGEEYWRIFAAVVPTDPKAYLGTFLKALSLLLRPKLLARPALSQFPSQSSQRHRPPQMRRNDYAAP